MNKRTRRSGELVPFTKVPTVAITSLSADAFYLYGFLLAFHDTVSGRLVDLRLDGRMRRAGLSERRLHQAAQELIDQGLYTYEDVRRPDGTVARDLWVTEVPGALSPPSPTRRAAAAARTGASRAKASSQRVDSVRPAPTHPADAIAAGQHRIDTQGVDSVRPAETGAGTGIAAGQHRNDTQGVDSVRPAETDALDSLYAGQDGYGVARASSFRETDRQNPPPSPQPVPGPRRHPEEEEISISTQEARSWLQRLPCRSRLRPGTTLGPVVAQFLSAPGPWPREVLKAELCHDLETAKNVEAVLHTRLKNLNPAYDPAEYAPPPAAPSGVVVDGERVPVEALRPPVEDRRAAHDEYRQAMARLRAAASERPR